MYVADVIVAVLSVSMVMGLAIFILRYNRSAREIDEAANEVESEINNEPPVVQSQNIIIVSIKSVKVKTYLWLIANGCTKEEADAILADISKPFNAEGMDLDTAPFKYIKK